MGNLGVPTVRKLIVCAAALSGFAIQANAADLLGGAKDPLPDALTYKGVTVYGTVDVGYGYQREGLPASGSNYNGFNWQLNKVSSASQSALVNNALSQSIVGLRSRSRSASALRLSPSWKPALIPSLARSPTLAANLGSVIRAAVAVTRTFGDTFGDGNRCGQRSMARLMPA